MATRDPTDLSAAALAAEAAARQRLRGTRDEDALTALRGTVGVYGSAPAFALSSVARGVSTAAEVDALVDARRLVRLRCMRSSVYAVPIELFPTVFAATRERVLRDRLRGLRWAAIEEDEVRRLEPVVREALAGGRLATVPELREIVDAVAPLSPGAHEHFSILTALWAAEGILVRAGTRDGWRGDTVTYALMEEWLPGLELDEVDAGGARAELARLYLRAFGPATTLDFHWWSGLGKRAARVAMAAALGREPYDTQQVCVDDPPEVAADVEPLRLLPAWDTYLVGYRDRGRQMAEEHMPWVYDRMGNATSVVLHDGVVVGVWQLHDGSPTEVSVAWLPGAPVPDHALVEAEAGRTAALLGLDEPAVRVVPLPPPLAARARNAHLAPLPRSE
jgi:hypothetical protein